MNQNAPILIILIIITFTDIIKAREIGTGIILCSPHVTSLGKFGISPTYLHLDRFQSSISFTEVIRIGFSYSGNLNYKQL